MNRPLARIGQRTLSLLAALAFLTQAGCGTLIYDERRGQTSGDIDPAIAILDGVGLIFFIVPGLIAFAIDFATGCIYLPGTGHHHHHHHSAIDPADLRAVQLDRTDPATIAAAVAQHTGHVVDWQQPGLRAVRLADRHAMQVAFSQFTPATAVAQRPQETTRP